MEIIKVVRLDCKNGTVSKPPGASASFSSFSLVSLVYQLFNQDDVLSNFADH